MTKKEIIGIIDKIIAPKADNDRKFFGGKSDSTGNNQYRNLADMCLRADCPEEIEILIQYKAAKSINGESWSHKYKGKTFGETVLDAMNEIKSASDGDKDCLNNFSLLFGYLYWSARVWSAASTKEVVK